MPAGMDAPKDPLPPHAIRDPDTGEAISIIGYGSMKDRPLQLRPDIDLLKPIFAQAMKDEPEESTP